MKTYIMCSGGKDSVATCILAYENKIPIDGVVIGEVMFDHSRNISAEHPLHADWLHNVLIPTLRDKFGYEVIVLKAKDDYISMFNKRISKSKCVDRIGKKKGFPLGFGCTILRDLKLKPINDWCKNQGEFISILGIAYDEVSRLEYMHRTKNKRSLMEEYKIIEEQAFDICRPYNLLSPYYDLGLKRQGCWFCPNCSIKTFAQFKKDYPQLWEELKILSQDKEVVCSNFRYGMTFNQVDKQIMEINNQVTMFDLIEENNNEKLF